MKRWFQNLSKGKLAVCLIAVCLLVLGGYFGYHRFTVHAGNAKTKQVVNTLAQYRAMSESGNIDPTQEAGDKNNPFLILEIVPYYGQAEIGYLISGCEPIDLYDVDQSVYGGSSDGTRSISTCVFPDEFQRDADGDGAPDEEWSDDWHKETSSVTTHGYYEKVADGNPGDFVIDHYEADTSGMFNYTDDAGVEHPAYRPVFRKAQAGEKGQFIWVSIYTDSASGVQISEGNFNKLYARKENKTTDSPDKTIEYKPGEREYTTRTESEYYCINRAGWTAGKGFAGHHVNMNDFIRTSLNLEDKSQVAIDKLKIAVKTIEPRELKNYPEWIDYADLIYIHQGHSVGAYGDWWKKAEYAEHRSVKDELGESFYKGSGEDEAALITKKFTADNDWGWDIAKKMFCKINQMEEYDGNGTYGFAPMLFSVTALDNLNGISEAIYNKDGKYRNLTNNHLDYTTMEAGGLNYTGGATSCGLYKFMLMNFLMDQVNFHKYFFEINRASTGAPVIDANGNCTPQKSADAQAYWNVDAFLPITEKVNDTNISDDQIERYAISHFGGAYLNYPRPSLHGATFVYNSDTLLSQGFNNASIQKNNDTQEAFDWFLEEYGVDYDSITPAQMVHYLLQYKKHGSNQNDLGTPDKEPMRVLEIEPCNDFFITEEYLIGKYLPPARFEGSIEVDHMTTAEFNGLKRDIIGDYDLIYIGDNIGKFNVNNNDKTKYNDADLDEFIYLHVGDKAGNLRSSGDDISKLKQKELQSYAQGGNALVLADDLAYFPVDDDGEDVTSGKYITTYKKIVDQTSNMHALLNSLKSTRAPKFKKNNVCSLSKLSLNFLAKYCVGYMNEGFSLPTRYETGLTTKEYELLEERYKSMLGVLYKITSTPPTYISDAGMSDDSGETGDVKQKLQGSSLDFSFLIGDQGEDSKYAVRLYLDLDGNGVISDNELVKDTYGNNSGTTYSFSGVQATDKDGNPYVDREGKEILVPREQSFGYDFSGESRLYLNRNRRSGALTWRFVLYNVKSPDSYLSRTGTSWYENPNASPKKGTLHALQIVSDTARGSAADLQTQLTKSSLFATYASNLDDYEISIDTVTLSEFKQQAATAGAGDTAADAADAESSVTDEDYNGYIVSCGSELFTAAGNDDETTAAVNFLTAKAKQGIGIVFTGDVTPDKFDANVKDLMNMSRFTDASFPYGDYNDTAKSPKNTKYSNEAAMEETYAHVMKDGSGSYKVYRNNLWKDISYGSAPAKANAISRNNKGSITVYPYTIDKDVSISGDAAQDFQLNMDNPDLVVWYSLDGADNSLYGISPRDASNNYYLYSVSNVTYDLIDLATVSDPMEMKLFINALVGSIRAMAPQVVVDSGKAVDSSYKDFGKIEDVTKDYFGDSTGSAGVKKADNDAEITVFKGALQPNGGGYQDYEAGAKKVVSGTTPGNTGGGDGDDDDDDATPAPATPTPVPKKDPVILYTSSDANGDWAGNYSTSDASIFDGWSDSAVVVVEYNTENTWSGENEVIGGFFNQSNVRVGDLRNKRQAKAFSLSEIAQMYGVSSASEIPYFRVAGASGGEWQFRLITLGIFEDMAQFNSYKNGGGSGDGGDTGTGEDIVDESDEDALGDHTEITDKKGYVPTTATHRINFTPYTNLTSGVNVNSFKISLISASVDKLGTAKEKTISYMDTIYQKYTDAAGKHIFKYEAEPLTHTFSISQGNFLKDKTQYYFFSDDSYINNTTAYDNDNTRWVRFDISNRRKAGVTYLHLYYEGDVDTTYVFPLD